ncbi:MAG: hypothetical protein OEZ34_03610 [Spirochaetia bacterium]|nr:hypothetical protein [Spirochaetia bacterium]
MRIFTNQRKYIFKISLSLILLVECGLIGISIEQSLERNKLEDFFKNQNFEIDIERTERVDDHRIYLHYFSVPESDVKELAEILKLGPVLDKDYYEIHTDRFANADLKIHCSFAGNYIVDKNILFYKEAADDKTGSKILLVSKVYLLYNKKTKQACFQIYYRWG